MGHLSLVRPENALGNIKLNVLQAKLTKTIVTLTRTLRTIKPNGMIIFHRNEQGMFSLQPLRQYPIFTFRNVI